MLKKIQKIVDISSIIFLAACSSDQHYKLNISENKEYLKAPSLKALKIPTGIVLPSMNNNYDIPSVIHNNAVSKELDIRPPTQQLIFSKKFYFQYTNATVAIPLNISSQCLDIWSKIILVMQKKHYPIISLPAAKHDLTTDWINWVSIDDNQQYKDRYQISLINQNNQILLKVRSLGLQRKNQLMYNNTKLVQRYTVALLSSIVHGLEELSDEYAYCVAHKQTSGFSVQSSIDDGGLPLLIIQSPYDNIWLNLPMALSHIGMKVKNSNYSLGTLLLTYKARENSICNNLDVNGSQLHNGDYKLQIGDYGNYNTLQFTDRQGYTLTKSQNDILAVILQIALNNCNTMENHTMENNIIRD